MLLGNRRSRTEDKPTVSKLVTFLSSLKLKA